MSKFKDGDILVATKDTNYDGPFNLSKGDKYTVSDTVSIGVYLEEFDGCGCFDDDLFELENPNRHPHADLIIAWANGAKIEYCDADGFDEWMSIEDPSWNKKCKYRIKPEPKPDVVIERHVFISDKDHMYFGLLEERPNAKFTFDAETLALKNIEIL